MMALTKVLVCSVLLTAVTAHSGINQHSLFDHGSSIPFGNPYHLLQAAAKLTYPITSGLNKAVGQIARPVYPDYAFNDDPYDPYPRTYGSRRYMYDLGLFGNPDYNVDYNTDYGNGWNLDYDYGNDFYGTGGSTEYPIIADDEDYEDPLQVDEDFDYKNDIRNIEDPEETIPEFFDGENTATPDYLNEGLKPDITKHKDNVKMRPVDFPNTKVNGKTSHNAPNQQNQFMLMSMTTNQGNMLVPVSLPTQNPSLMSGANPPGNVLLPVNIPSGPGNMNNGNTPVNLMLPNGQPNLYTILNIPSGNPATNMGKPTLVPINIYGQPQVPGLQTPGTHPGFYLVPAKIS